MGLLKDNRGYFAREYVAGRGSRRIQRVFGQIPKSEARVLYAEFLAEILGTHDPETNKPNLSAVTLSYLESSRNTLKPRSLKIIKEVYLEKHWTFFKDIPAESITAELVEQYRTHRLSQHIGGTEKTTANGTVNREVDTLQAVLNRAVRAKNIAANPIKGQIKALPERGKVTFFSPEEYSAFNTALLDWKALLDRAEGQARMKVEKYQEFYLGNSFRAVPLFQTMLLTCSRLSEITTLNWFDVDFNSKKITIHQHKVGSDKVLDITPDLFATLDSLYKAGEKHGLVFRRQDGSAWEGEYLDRVFKTALSIAKIDRPYTIHTIRHTGASWMVQAGISIFEVSKMLGHSNIQTTMKYAHLAPKQLETAMNAISAAFKPLGSVATSASVGFKQVEENKG